MANTYFNQGGGTAGAQVFTTRLLSNFDSVIVIVQGRASGGPCVRIERTSSLIKSKFVAGARIRQSELLSTQIDYSFVQGGANAGHTIYNEKGQKFALHGVPSGVLNPKATCLVGNGVVVHLPSFFDELDKLQSQGVNTEGRVLVSDRYVRTLIVDVSIEEVN